MFKSIFRGPEGGVATGLGTLIAVYLIYNASLPPGVDVRAGDANDDNIEAARKGAAWKSGAVVGLVFLLTRDLNAFIVSGIGLGGIDYMYKHHNAFNPHSGKLEGNESGGQSMASVHPLPNYDSGSAEDYA